MATKEYIKRAFDANAFISTDSEATTVNPAIWDRKLREFEEKALVVAPLAEQFDFRMPGRDMTVTIDDRPAAASDVAETDAVGIVAFTTRQVTFDPSETGVAYEVSRKELVRAFFDVMERMVRKIGYAMAEKKDADCVSAIYSGATSNLNANSVSAASDVTDTDTLDLASILEGIKTIEELFYHPDTLIVSPTQKHQLLQDSSLNKILAANEWGTRETINRGSIGSIVGLNVYVSHMLTAATVTGNTDDKTQRAIVLGGSRTGERAFGVATKRDAMIETDYHARERRFELVGHEDYDVEVLHPDAIATIRTYNSAA